MTDLEVSLKAGVQGKGASSASAKSEKEKADTNSMRARLSSRIQH